MTDTVETYLKRRKETMSVETPTTALTVVPRPDPGSLVQVHPAAAIFPMMPEPELQALATNIKEFGLIEPVILYRGSILDGRNRKAACERVGVGVRYVEADLQGLTPTEYVVARNLHRRHLTASQRAAIGVELLPGLRLESAEHRRANPLSGLAAGSDKPHHNPRHDMRDSRELAGRMMQCGGKTISDAQRIKQEDPESFAKVVSGELTVGEALRKIGVLRRRERPDTSGRKIPERVGRGARDRVVEILSTANGLCRGLSLIDIHRVAVGMPREDRPTWVRISRECAKTLRDFATRLEEVK